MCVLIFSPQGACLDPEKLRCEMQEALQLPVYDIMMIEKGL